MKCPTCAGPMLSRRENFNYKASGLPVTLVGVEVRRCKACGDFEVVIHRIEALHRAIAHAIVGKRSRLMPAEVRFLRTYLGWNGGDFAKRIGVASETVSRWENGHDKMSPVADRLLRLMVQTASPVADYSLDFLADLDGDRSPLRLEAEIRRGVWKAAPVAA